MLGVCAQKRGNAVLCVLLQVAVEQGNIERVQRVPAGDDVFQSAKLIAEHCVHSAPIDHHNAVFEVQTCPREMLPLNAQVLRFEKNRAEVFLRGT